MRLRNPLRRHIASRAATPRKLWGRQLHVPNSMSRPSALFRWWQSLGSQLRKNPADGDNFIEGGLYSAMGQKPATRATTATAGSPQLADIPELRCISCYDCSMAAGN